MAEKKSRLSKLTVLFTIVIIGAVGLLGVFNKSPVNIEAFAEYVKAFAAIFVPFAAVVAVGSESKRYITTKYGENLSTTASNEGTTEGGK